MQSIFQKKFLTKAILLLILISLNGCTTAIPDACAWLRPVSPDQGFQDRWTHNEKVQIDQLDQSIDKNCGASL